MYLNVLLNCIEHNGECITRSLRILINPKLFGNHKIPKYICPSGKSLPLYVRYTFSDYVLHTCMYIMCGAIIYAYYLSNYSA